MGSMINDKQNIIRKNFIKALYYLLMQQHKQTTDISYDNNKHNNVININTIKLLCLKSGKDRVI